MPVTSVQPIFHLERGEHGGGRTMTDVTWFFGGYFLCVLFLWLRLASMVIRCPKRAWVGQ